jgi:cullin-4
LELRRTLKSLACGHYALLLKQPAGLDVEPTDYFMYNTDFESTDTHISLNTEKLNEAIENNASIDATVLIPREQQVTTQHGLSLAYSSFFASFRWTLLLSVS